MTHRSIVTALVVGLVAVSCAAAETPSRPTREAIEREMGLRSEGDLVRGQRDTVGFVVTREQAEDVVTTAVGLERDAIVTRDAELGLSPEHGFVGGVCPHDDHLYAARTYVHLTERITAPRVVLVGVFHAARLWDLSDVLVFDDFTAWHGPWQPVPVDPIRGEVLARLGATSFVVDNAMHEREHSLEAIVPFLQARNREVTILPMLVPYASWDRLAELADELAGVLAGIVDERGWRLGRDLAIVVSSDAVHYGPDFDHAPFGTDAAGYQRAVSRELELAGTYLEGPLEPDRLAALEYTLVAREDVHSYRLPWCGRFSVPFGLELLRTLAEKTGMPTPQGHLLRSATSLAGPLLPVSQATLDAGLGTTAPANLHHWVGYLTIGFTAYD